MQLRDATRTLACLGLAMVGWLACGTSPQPQPSVTTVDAPQPASSSSEHGAHEEGANEGGAAQPSDATSQPAAQSSGTAPVLRPGKGSCSTDADCVASSVLDNGPGETPSCCSYICPPGTVRSKTLDQQLTQQRDKHCATHHELCPPPAPCRRSPIELVPRCQAGQCAGEERALPKR
jgi:hypothetical protein